MLNQDKNPLYLMFCCLSVEQNGFNMLKDVSL